MPFCGFQTASAAKVGWAAQATHAVSVSITAASNTNPHAAKRPSENCKTRFSDGLRNKERVRRRSGTPCFMSRVPVAGASVCFYCVAI